MNVMTMLKKTLALVLVFALFLVLIPVPAMAAETDGTEGTETECTHEKFDEYVYAPTCTEQGYTLYICATNACPYNYKDNYVDALGHAYEETARYEPDCVINGSVEYACTRENCNDHYEEILEAPGHVFEEVTVDGVTSFECKNCDYGYTDEPDTDEHDYFSIVYDPTCEEEGYTLHTCSICGDTYTTDHVDALGHSYTATVYAPTCTEDGITVNTCANCGDTYYTEPVDALGHNYVTSVVAPTCTTAGYTAHTCTACGDTYTTDPATVLGHSYTVKVTSSGTTYTCKTCGYTYTKQAAAASYKKVSTFSAGSSYVIAVYNGRTAYALTHANNKISATKITISGGKVTSTVTEDMLWDYAAGKLSYEDDGVTYNLHSSGTTLTLSTSTYSFVTYSTNKLKVGSYYLRYTSGTIKGNRTAGTTYLMEETK